MTDLLALSAIAIPYIGTPIFYNYANDALSKVGIGTTGRADINESFTLTFALVWSILGFASLNQGARDALGSATKPLDIALPGLGNLAVMAGFGVGTLVLYHSISVWCSRPFDLGNYARQNVRWWSYIMKEIVLFFPKLNIALLKAFFVKILRTSVELFMGIIQYVFRMLGLESLYKTFFKPLLDAFRTFMDVVTGGLELITGGVDKVKKAIDVVAGAVSGVTDKLDSVIDAVSSIGGAAGGAADAIGSSPLNPANW